MRPASLLLFVAMLTTSSGGCRPRRPAAPAKSAPQPWVTSDDTRGAEVVWEPTRGLRQRGHIATITDYHARWAMIVGIDAYPDGDTGLKPLEYAVNDAREFRNLLHWEFGYDSDHIRHLTDGEATREAIREALTKWLAARNIREEDSFLFFFAGHGLIDPRSNQGYLAAVDSTADDLEGSCLAVSWLKAQFEKAGCRHKLMILDSCYSGSLFQKDRRQQAAPGARIGPISAPGRGAADPYADERIRGPGTTTPFDNLSYYFNQPVFLGISAGRLTPVADGSGENRHSVFTAALLDVLRERANSPRADRAFTFRRAAAEVEDRVANAAGSRQIPDWGRLDPGDGDFVFRPVLARLTPREIAERQEYAKRISQAYGQWKSNDPAEAEKSLEDCPAALRHWEWRYLKRLCHPERFTMTGHAFEVNCVRFSHDGKWIASGSGPDLGGGEVILADAATGKVLYTWGDQVLKITAVAFSPDDKRLASAGWDGTINVWDVDSRERVLTIDTGQGRVHAAVFSPDGKWIASAGHDKTVRLWHAADGRAAGMLSRHQGAVRALDVSSDSRRLVSAGEGGLVIVWDLSKGQPIDNFPIPDGDSPIFPAGKSGQSPSHSPAAPKEDEPRVFDEHDAQSVAVAISRDGKWIVSIDEQGRAVCREVSGGEPRFDVSFSGGPRCVAFSPDGEQIAWGGLDRSIHLCDAETGREIANIRGHADRIAGLAFSPDGRRIASGARDKTVKVWDASKQEECLVFSEHADSVNDLAFGPEGRVLASADNSGRVLIWETDGKRVLHDLAAHEIAAKCVAFRPDGRRLASGGSDRVVRVWNVDDGSERFASEEFGSGVNCVAFSPDGTRLAAGSADKTLRIWDANSGERLFTLGEHTHSVNGLAFSPDGARLFTCAASTFERTETEWKVFEVGSGKEIPEFSGTGGVGYVEDVAYSGDGRWLASAGPDNQLQLWDARTGRVFYRAQAGEEHTSKDFITAVAFTPDGRRLISGARDATVKIWDTLGGLPLFTLRGFQGPVTAVAVSPDGRRVAAAGRDNTVRIWDAAWPDR